jgi:hypothetical protein
MDCLADSARVHLGLFDTEEVSWYQYLSILISSAGTGLQILIHIHLFGIRSNKGL